MDTAITIALCGGVGLVLRWVWIWATESARWEVIAANWQLLLVGRYPDAQLWRLSVAAAVIAVLAGMTWGAGRWRRWPLAAFAAAGLIAAWRGFQGGAPLAIGAGLWAVAGTWGLLWGASEIGRRLPGQMVMGLWLAAFPVLMWLVAGGLGLEAVASSQLTGLVLTMLAAVTSIVLSFPLGLLLALGRRSELPAVRWLSAGYIEIVRGLPLVGVLFLAQVMLPLFLPAGMRLDRLVRAIAGLTLFSAAYLAENVRGGLQSVPRGQVEAARALGLKAPAIALLIVLPQALRVALPPITNQFIGLLKNTALLSVVGLVELVGIARSVLANPAYLGRYAEVYVFIGAIYWAICSGMSIISQYLEKQTARDRRA